MKNKKQVLFSLTLLVLLLLLQITVTKAQTPSKPVIVCTTSAVGSVVEAFLGDTADVLVLVQPGLCPADFDMKPGYIDAVSKAQILFKQNIQGEFWLDSLLTAAGNRDLVEVVIPGVYNTPEGAKNYIRGVGGNLSQILGLDLSEKTLEMLSTVDEISSLMANQAATIDAANVKVICMAWLQTFVESAGFTVVATFNPPETLSAGDITNLLETAQTEGVALVVDNLQIDTEFGAEIASQVGAEHVVLTNFPGAVPKTDSLSDMLKYNAEQLFNGNIIWQSISTIKNEKVDLQNQITIFQIVASVAVIAAVTEALLLYAKRTKKS